jgi:hypothetical protein
MPERARERERGRRRLVVMMLLCVHSGGIAICAGADARLLIDVEHAGIRIDVAGHPLWVVADALQSRSGIRFDVEARVRNESVNGVAEGGSWSQVVATLLDGYNRIVVSRDDGTIERVLILNHGNLDARALGTQPESQQGDAPRRVPLPPGEKIALEKPWENLPTESIGTTPGASDPEGPSEIHEPPERGLDQHPGWASDFRMTDGSVMPSLRPSDLLTPDPPSPSMGDLASGPAPDRPAGTTISPIDVAPPPPEPF